MRRPRESSGRTKPGRRSHLCSFFPCFMAPGVLPSFLPYTHPARFRPCTYWSLFLESMPQISTNLSLSHNLGLCSKIISSKRSFLTWRKCFLSTLTSPAASILLLHSNVRQQMSNAEQRACAHAHTHTPPLSGGCR